MAASLIAIKLAASVNENMKISSTILSNDLYLNLTLYLNRATTVTDSNARVLIAN